MRKLVLINPYCPEFSKRERLEKILSYALDGYSCTEIGTAEEMAQTDLRGSRILLLCPSENRALICTCLRL